MWASSCCSSVNSTQPVWSKQEKWVNGKWNQEREFWVNGNNVRTPVHNWEPASTQGVPQHLLSLSSDKSRPSAQHMHYHSIQQGKTRFFVCGLLASCMIITWHWPFDPVEQFQLAFHRTLLKSRPWVWQQHGLSVYVPASFLLQNSNNGNQKSCAFGLALHFSFQNENKHCFELPRVSDRPQFLSATTKHFFLLSWPGCSDSISSF